MGGSSSPCTVGQIPILNWMSPFPESHGKRKQKSQCQMVQCGAWQAVPGELGSYESSINAELFVLTPGQFGIAQVVVTLVPRRGRAAWWADIS